LAALLDSDKYLKNFFDPKLTGVIEMSSIFNHLLHKRFRKLAAHIVRHWVPAEPVDTPPPPFTKTGLRIAPALASHQDSTGADARMYTTPWFMTVFFTSLPWTTVVRIWDAFFCEGTAAEARRQRASTLEKLTIHHPDQRHPAYFHGSPTGRKVLLQFALAIMKECEGTMPRLCTQPLDVVVANQDVAKRSFPVCTGEQTICCTTAHLSKKCLGCC